MDLQVLVQNGQLYLICPCGFAHFLEDEASLSSINETAEQHLAEHHSGS